jgi:hypothetical protein
MRYRKAMFERIVSVAAAAGLAACVGGSEPSTGTSEAPLIGGVVPASDEDLAIIALTSTNSRPFCSGTLVSPSVILTAAHCIDMFGGDPNITIFFGSDTYSEGTKIGVKLSKRHSGWTGNLGKYDVGLLLMNFPMDPELAVPLNTQAPQIDDTYRVAGFGISTRGEQADGKKRQGTTAISGVRDGTSSDILENGDDMISVCFGDSGGPGFLTFDGVEYVAGIHSYTQSEQCYPPNGDTRVDLYVDDFILPWIQANDPVCGADGICAKIGCVDDPDCTPCGPDGTCVSDCPLPDPDCPTSELGDLCRADTMCTTELCVFWEGDPNTRFCSRPCDKNSDDCPDGMSCRTVQPFGDICYYDDDPDGVLGDSCEVATDCGSYICDQGYCAVTCDLSVGRTCPTGFECAAGDGDYFCHASDEGGGGCSAAGRTGAGAGLLALAALLLVRRRRAG